MSYMLQKVLGEGVINPIIIKNISIEDLLIRF